jgi:hypothetical protein
MSWVLYQLGRAAYGISYGSGIAYQWLMAKALR